MTTITRVLDRAWRAPFSTKSDFARTYADFVALAACEGYITTQVAIHHYGRTWVITPKGLRHLAVLKDLDLPDEE